MSGDLPLASRLLLREWRAGELRVMLLALLIAVTVSTAISFFTGRLQRGMVTRAAEFLGADMRLSSPDPWPDEALQEAIKNTLHPADIVHFSSITSSDTGMLLSLIRAVGPGYPLRGEVRISNELPGPERTATATPQPGTVWVEARLLS